MRKIIFCLLMLFVSSINYAQNANIPESILMKIGEYKVRDRMYAAEAYVSLDTSLVYRYRIPATHTVFPNFYPTYMPMVYIDCTPSMMDDLLKIVARYKEWAKIAKENNLGKMQKKIELEFPFSMISLHKNAKGYPRYIEAKNRIFTFNFSDPQKSPSIFCNQEFKDDVTKLTVSTGLSFSSPEEFEAFVNFLNPEKVIQRIKEGKTTLFPQEESTEKKVVSEEVTLQELPVVNTSSNRQSVDIGKIARSALERWKNAARSVSGQKN